MAYSVRLVLRLLFCAMVALSVGSARADVIHVPGDYATIQEAINASFDGDMVAVAAGTYTGPGNRDVTFGGKAISVSGAGPGLTIVDCQGTPSDPHRGFLFDNGESENSVLEGLTVTNAYANGDGGAVLVGSGALPVVRECEFIGNGASGQGSGINRSAHVVECVFTGNTGRSAAICGPSGSLVNCEFAGNLSEFALMASGGAVESCRISGNLRGALAGDGSTFLQCEFSGNGLGLVLNNVEFATFDQCTFAGHSVALYVDWGFANFYNCVFWNNNENVAMGAGEVSMACCLFEANSIAGVTFEGPQIHVDPQFCDPRDSDDAPTSEGDYRVADTSICLPENNECGVLLGALGVGCGVSSVGDHAVGMEQGLRLRFTSAMPTKASLEFAIDGLHSRDSAVTLELLDPSGRRLGERQVLLAGSSGHWSPRESGIDLTSGVYILRVTASQGTASARFVWLE